MEFYDLDEKMIDNFFKEINNELSLKIIQKFKKKKKRQQCEKCNKILSKKNKSKMPPNILKIYFNHKNVLKIKLDILRKVYKEKRVKINKINEVKKSNL